jgi:hypothetical protein
VVLAVLRWSPKSSTIALVGVGLSAAAGRVLAARRRVRDGNASGSSRLGTEPMVRQLCGPRVRRSPRMAR